jgi:hypothetical protein
MPNYTQETMKDIALQIGQCREAGLNNLMKRKSTIKMTQLLNIGKSLMNQK